MRLSSCCTRHLFARCYCLHCSHLVTCCDNFIKRVEISPSLRTSVWGGIGTWRAAKSTKGNVRVKELLSTRNSFISMSRLWIVLPPTTAAVGEWDAPGCYTELLGTDALIYQQGNQFSHLPHHEFKFSYLETSDDIRRLPFQGCIMLSTLAAQRGVEEDCSSAVQ